MKEGLKNLFHKLWSKWDSIVKWVHDQFQLTMNRFSEDLRSMRIIWIWLLLSLFFWVIIWCVLNYAERTGTTAIITLGGMVTIIIQTYILAKQHDKHLKCKEGIEKVKSHTPTVPTGPADPGGDGNG